MASVKLTKSYTTSTGKKLPIGTIINVSRANYKRLMDTRSAEHYNGDLPPKKKTETNFFKPKT